MKHLNETLMQLISCEVLGKELHLPAESVMNDKFLVELLVLSRKHDVANIVASALLNNGFLENCPQRGQYMNEIYKSLYTYEKQKATLEQISEVFIANRIDHIPLKGAVIRKFYPQPWMRTGCDIDILVKEKDLQKATDVLLGIEGYCLKNESSHDLVFSTGDSVLIELHYKLLGSKKSPLYSSAISSVWKTAIYDGNSNRCCLSNEVFYYYHILHMAKHFRIGGCGVRPFLDLYIIENNHNIDYEKVEKLLRKSKLRKFAENARKLSRVWFSGEEHSELTLQMQSFVLDGGTFGTVGTRAESVYQRKGNKFNYALSRVFVPYRYLKRDYPIIEKYPILTPLFELCRIFSLMFGKKKAFREIYINRLNMAADNDYDNDLFKKLKLK